VCVCVCVQKLTPAERRAEKIEEMKRGMEEGEVCVGACVCAYV